MAWLPRSFYVKEYLVYKEGNDKKCPLANIKGVSQPLTVPCACAISPEHLEGARLVLFLCKVLQEDTSLT
jgi:hypothetical protein